MNFEYDLSPFIAFRDTAECARVRAIKKADITKHENPDFHISVIEEPAELFGAMASDLVFNIKRSLDEGKKFVCILPVGPTTQYPVAARMINRLRIPMHHIHTFNMDEYADQDGMTAPATWVGSFQKAMMDTFFGLIDPDLRPPMDQVHFPASENIHYYGRMLEDAGDADVCYGGIGWCGHIAFWEADLGHEFGNDLDAYMRAGPRIVPLSPMTIMQNALHSFGGDWSMVPPQAASIGPAEVMRARYRSFWLPYYDGSTSWQSFIARLCAHGRVNTLVPGSILQTAPGDYVILGRVAQDIEVHMT